MSMAVVVALAQAEVVGGTVAATPIIAKKVTSFVPVHVRRKV